ncbi:hypothetical protein [Kiloniella sp.]|uniref:hypothetical protein n=1 Tax=Kiloniella sp. TaxID=1938587 RepID=UPI003B020427
MSVIGNGVTLLGFPQEDSQFTVNLASGITAEHIGRPLALDASAANTMKLASAGDVIVAALVSVENRTIEGVLVGTAALKFIEAFPVNTGAPGTLSIGDTVEGSGTGQVQTLGGASPTPDHSVNYVAEILDGGNTAVVVKL